MEKTLRSAELPGDPPVPDYSGDGVDLSLIRWFLSLTPAERLEFAERNVDEILAIRELNAGQSSTERQP